VSAAADATAAAADATAASKTEDGEGRIGVMPALAVTLYVTSGLIVRT